MNEIYYLMEHGTLRKKDGTIQFDDGRKARLLPVERVKELHVFGEVDVSKKCLELLGRKGIIVHWYSFYGRYVGSYHPSERSSSGAMTLLQSRFYEDVALRTTISHAIIEASYRQMIRLLKEHAHQLHPRRLLEFERAFQLEKGTPPELFLQEAALRQRYYRLLDDLFRLTPLRFEKRTRRPPGNEVNALMSFANTMLYQLVLSELMTSKLDPGIGYLHATNDRQYSLQLDLAELFKPYLVDGFIFTLVQQKTLQKEDFEWEEAACYLNPLGRKKFLHLWREQFKKTVYHDQLKRYVPYRELIRLEIYALQQHFNGKAYQPLTGFEWP